MKAIEKTRNGSRIRSIFIGMGIGAVIGLITYVKDWL